MLQWRDGREYRGEFVKDKREGFGQFKWADGRSYQGYWEGGKQHGLGIFTNFGGEEKKGEWKYGRRIRWISDNEASRMNFSLPSQTLFS